MSNEFEALDAGYDSHEESRKESFNKGRRLLADAISWQLEALNGMEGVTRVEVESDPTGLVRVTAFVTFFITANHTRKVSCSEINWNKAINTSERLYYCLLGVRLLVRTFTESACLEADSL